MSSGMTRTSACGIVTNPPKRAADGSLPFPTCYSKWNAVLAWLSNTACVVFRAIDTHHSSGQGSRLASTRFDHNYCKHASQHNSFGSSLLHKDHTPFLVDFFWNLFFPQVGSGLKEARHTPVPWSEIPKAPATWNEKKDTRRQASEALCFS